MNSTLVCSVGVVPIVFFFFLAIAVVIVFGVRMFYAAWWKRYTRQFDEATKLPATPMSRPADSKLHKS